MSNVYVKFAGARFELKHIVVCRASRESAPALPLNWMFRTKSEASQAAEKIAAEEKASDKAILRAAETKAKEIIKCETATASFVSSPDGAGDIITVICSDYLPGRPTNVPDRRVEFTRGTNDSLTIR